MWHDEPEVVRFLEAAHWVIPEPGLVVELGSYRMHDHDPRPLWPGAAWVGVDAREGPGVEAVGLAHEVLGRMMGPMPTTGWPWLSLPPGSRPLVLSVSALEHDPHWAATLEAARRYAVLRGGVVAVTCAGQDWEPHELDCAPGGAWYGNRTSAEIAAALHEGARRVVEWDSLRTCAPHWTRSNVIAEY